MNKIDVFEYIKETTYPVNAIKDRSIKIFLLLSNELYNEKSLVRTNSIQFICAKILTKQGRVINLNKRDFFLVYVIGEFRKSFGPTLRVAEAFANFYSEMGVLPFIISLPMYLLKKDKELLHKIRNSVLMYERR